MSSDYIVTGSAFRSIFGVCLFGNITCAYACGWGMAETATLITRREYIRHFVIYKWYRVVTQM